MLPIQSQPRSCLMDIKTHHQPFTTPSRVAIEGTPMVQADSQSHSNSAIAHNHSEIIVLWSGKTCYHHYCLPYIPQKRTASSHRVYITGSRWTSQQHITTDLLFPSLLGRTTTRRHSRSANMVESHQKRCRRARESQSNGDGSY
jgi:hypothetical protein